MGYDYKLNELEKSRKFLTSLNFINIFLLHSFILNMFHYNTNAEGQLKSFTFFPIENEENTYLATLNGKNLRSPVKIKSSFISEVVAFQWNQSTWGEEANLLMEGVFVVKITTSNNDVYCFVFDGLDIRKINHRANKLNKNFNCVGSTIDTLLSFLFGYPVYIYTDENDENEKSIPRGIKITIPRELSIGDLKQAENWSFGKKERNA